MIYTVTINDNLSVVVADVSAVHHEKEHTILRNDRKEIVGIFKNSDYQFIVKHSPPTELSTVDYLAQARFFNNG